MLPVILLLHVYIRIKSIYFPQEDYGILSAWENHRAKAATLHHGGANPPDQRGKEGDTDDYISGFFLVLYLRCRPYQSDLTGFKGKEIAANYCE